MAQRTQKIAYLFVSLSILFWGSTAAVVKLLSQSLNNIQILLFASLFATISLFTISLLQGKWKIIKKYTLKDYWNFIWMGFIGVFLYYVFLYGALELSSAQEAFIINYTWPLWIVVLAVPFLGEALGSKKVIAILLGFLGVYIVATNGTLISLSSQHILGDILALAGAFCYGLFSVLGKKYKYETFTSMAFYFLVTFILTLITVSIFSTIPKITTFDLLDLLWIGIFPSGLAFVFWFLALKHGNTSIMSNIVLLTPFVSLIYIFFILNEPILLSSIIGLVLIVAGILFQRLK